MFDGCAVKMRDVTLSTGDYAIPADCTHDPEPNTYHPRFAVERKIGHDFLTSLTWERDRFTSELQQAAEWPRPITVVVETSWQTVPGCEAQANAFLVGTLQTDGRNLSQRYQRGSPPLQG
ncbi:ERCC4 domain-containing protein [Halobacterium sp. KA-4]|uniref:ERCC4 domain-containing protein n=1 Tax=Halobacterium sp. KA-4 TaxID=2896367 RepID=UPI002E7AB964|nr:ERCC4 domain-containing protein [Halobacterium sp. KA-4]